MRGGCKITVWVVGGIIFLCACVIGVFVLKDVLNPDFKETEIYPDESRVSPKDTVINVNGVEIKMIGVKGGKNDCQGLKKTIELEDFYIGETEVTQELWSAIMGGISSQTRRCFRQNDHKIIGIDDLFRQSF